MEGKILNYLKDKYVVTTQQIKDDLLLVLGINKLNKLLNTMVSKGYIRRANIDGTKDETASWCILNKYRDR